MITGGTVVARENMDVYMTIKETAEKWGDWSKTDKYSMFRGKN